MFCHPIGTCCARPPTAAWCRCLPRSAPTDTLGTLHGRGDGKIEPVPRLPDVDASACAMSGFASRYKPWLQQLPALPRAPLMCCRCAHAVPDFSGLQHERCGLKALAWWWIYQCARRWRSVQPVASACAWPDPDGESIPSKYMSCAVGACAASAGCGVANGYRCCSHMQQCQDVSPQNHQAALSAPVVVVRGCCCPALAEPCVYRRRRRGAGGTKPPWPPSVGHTGSWSDALYMLQSSATSC